MPSAVMPPARYAALAAAAAPDAPKSGIRARSRRSPTTKDTNGPTDERPGRDDAMRAFEKTFIAVMPITPGSSKRNGVIEASNGAPNTTETRGGTIRAPTSALARVTNDPDRNARSVRSSLRWGSLRAAIGRSAIEIAPGRYKRISDKLTATT